MTITRSYFDKLIYLLEDLCKMDPNHIKNYIDCKDKLNSTISEIRTFNLFELNFSDNFYFLLSNENIVSIQIEKEGIIIELANQLSYIMTERLWYGGELLYHMKRLRISMLGLPADVRNKMFQKYFKTNASFLDDKSDENEKLEKRKLELEVKKESIKIGKSFRKINKAHYLIIKEQLKEKISNYRSYIGQNYKGFENNFSYFGKSIMAYLCDERKDQFVCRVHAYQSSNTSSVNFNEYIHDFVPCPPYNIEKIDSKLISWSWFGVYKKDNIVTSEFCNLDSIHSELVDLFIKVAPENEIIRFVQFLYRCNGSQILNSKKSTTTYFEIKDRAHNKVGIEIYHSQSRNLDDVSDSISKMNQKEIDSKRVLFTSKPDKRVIEKFTENSIDVNYFEEIMNFHFSNDNSELIHLYIKSRLIHIHKEDSPIDSDGKRLIRKLKSCPTGISGWASFEEISMEIFEFLFRDSFSKYICKKQSSNSNNQLRRDLVVHNNFNDNTSFWGRIYSEYKAKLIIVEFKNYSGEISHDTMHSTTKYLSDSTGNLIIIFSRKGAKNKLKKQQNKLLRDGKLLISFDEYELIEMIEEKNRKVDINYRLEIKWFELLNEH